MIEIGLTGWNDHPLLYNKDAPKKDRLRQYSSHFPVVEVDASFYAVQPQKNFRKWAEETPDSFSFVVKAYQGMTGHLRGKPYFDDKEEMFTAFKHSIEPLREAGKLAAVLFQYPPWFDCNRKHVNWLRYTKEKLGEIPAALEFRNRTWFEPEMKSRTLKFMEEEGWIHGICDEPQAGEGSVPIVLHATVPHLTLVRFHGRNVNAWKYKGQRNWRDVRYLYHYDKNELREWKERLLALKKQCERIIVIFNNNSGGHAAGNAKQLQTMLGVEYEGLFPRQMDLFNGI